MVYWATPRIAAVQPKIVAGRDVTAPDEIVLPDVVAGRDLTEVVGSTYPFQYTVRTGVDTGTANLVDLTVVGLFDNANPGSDGETAGYVSIELENVLIAAMDGLSADVFNPDSFSYPKAFVTVDSATNVPAVQGALTADGFAASSIVSQASELPRALSMLGAVNRGIAVALGLFCLGAGLGDRVRELLPCAAGTSVSCARSAGPGAGCSTPWSPRSRWPGAVCSVVAVVLGTLASLAITAGLQGSALGVTFADGVAAPDARLLVAVLLGLPAALTLGAWRPVRRLSAVEPDDALRQL